MIVGTTTTVIIPWRPTPDRLAPHKRVREFWRHHGFSIIEADSDSSRPFHAAQARNNGVRQADSEMVICCDADTIPDIGSVAAALSSIREDVIYPFSEYRLLPGYFADRSDLMSVPPQYRVSGNPGGIFVTRRQTYWAVGGMDERFEPRWGYEDTAFLLAAQTLSAATHSGGVVFAFDHPADRDMSDANPNRAKFGHYLTLSAEGFREYVGGNW